MRDKLPKRIHNVESGIINLDNDRGGGTHWVSFVKKGVNNISYFDSYGNLPPPIEVQKYLLSGGGNIINYNYNRYQKNYSYNCGHLCLQFLISKYE